MKEIVKFVLIYGLIAFGFFFTVFLFERTYEKPFEIVGNIHTLIVEIIFGSLITHLIYKKGKKDKKEINKILKDIKKYDENSNFKKLELLSNISNQNTNFVHGIQHEIKNSGLDWIEKDMEFVMSTLKRNLTLFQNIVIQLTIDMNQYSTKDQNFFIHVNDTINMMHFIGVDSDSSFEKIYENLEDIDDVVTNAYNAIHSKILIKSQ